MTRPGTCVQLVVPGGLDDPRRPSGGNVYDRHLMAGLADLGWCVHERRIPGSWPAPDADALAALDGVLSGLAAGSPVIVDGLVASAAPGVFLGLAGRFRLVVLVHLPLGVPQAAGGEAPASATICGERAVLSAASAVVTTSGWTRRWLLDTYDLDPGSVHVARPGVEVAPIVEPRDVGGGRLLCVAAVTAGKGHATLVDALGRLDRLGLHSWTCTCVGSLEVEAGFVAALRRRAERNGIAARWRLVGPLAPGAALDGAYAYADLVLLPSRFETYGMVVTEALARGLPVLATDTGGVREALGAADDATVPGILVIPGDAGALADALSSWLLDSGLRRRLRRRAAQRRRTLAPWSATAAQVSELLTEVVHEVTRW